MQKESGAVAPAPSKWVDAQVPSAFVLEKLLRKGNIPLEKWGRGVAKNVGDLMEDIATQKCDMQISPATDEIRRYIRVVKVQMRRGDRVLIEAFNEVGNTRKPTWQLLSVKLSAGEEPYEAAVKGVIREMGVHIRNPKISPQPQIHHETKFAPSYPGLVGHVEYYTFEGDGSFLPAESFATIESTNGSLVRHHWMWLSQKSWAQMANKKREELAKGNVQILSKGLTDMNEEVHQAASTNEARKGHSREHEEENGEHFQGQDYSLEALSSPVLVPNVTAALLRTVQGIQARVPCQKWRDRIGYNDDDDTSSEDDDDGDGDDKDKDKDGNDGTGGRQLNGKHNGKRATFLRKNANRVYGIDGSIKSRKQQAGGSQRPLSPRHLMAQDNNTKYKTMSNPDTLYILRKLGIAVDTSQTNTSQTNALQTKTQTNENSLEETDRQQLQSHRRATSKQPSTQQQQPPSSIHDVPTHRHQGFFSPHYHSSPKKQITLRGSAIQGNVIQSSPRFITIPPLDLGPLTARKHLP